MFLKKTIFGLIAGPFVLYIVVWGNWLLIGLTLFAVTAGLAEFYGLLRQNGFKPLFWAGMALGWVFMIMAWHDSGTTVQFLVTAGVIGVFVIQFLQARWGAVRYTISDLALTLFGSVYVGGLLSYAFGMKGIYEQYYGGIYPHDVIVVIPLAGAWASDSGASFAGKFLGRTPLCPEISPKKTVEGAVGGVAGGMAAVVLIGALAAIPLRHTLVLGLLCGFFGQLGDLTESSFKREMGVKDTGTLMMHSGGVLDRIDSILFSIPVTYYYFHFFIIPAL
ncbi:MAG: phosphatidate cytidylyltransferase [bacterium]